MSRGFNSGDSSKVKRKCLMVIRLKANKCYQELLCYLSSYINFLNIRLCGWLQALGRFQTFSPWSKTHPTMAVIIIVLGFVWSIICHYSRLCQTVVFNCLVRRPIVFGLTKPMVSVVYSLGLWSFNCFRPHWTDVFSWLFDCFRSIVWPVTWLVVCNFVCSRLWSFD